MMIKTYGYMTMAQGLDFVVDLKLGLYMKVPPRAMFRTQIWCTILSYVSLRDFNNGQGIHEHYRHELGH